MPISVRTVSVFRGLAVLAPWLAASLPSPSIAAVPGVDALQVDPRGVQPTVAGASAEAEQAIRRFRIPPGYKVEVFAAEPMLANPVAFTIDEKGRIYTAETYRYRSSVLDIRHYMPWLEDDLASRTTSDRLSLLKRKLGDQVSELQKETEVIRKIEDTDGDGKADKSTIFADGFNDVLDGIGSGVLARKGDVYFTNIPKLWRLRDTDGDGKADQRQALAEGFGVHYNFTGHDLHGLIIGPDGRLYYSIGDRGSHIKTKEGNLLDYPDEGVVFRSDLDGSNLEVFARGLRNPQELAFDQNGNLFTGDNDSDQGDRERWVYIMEGSDNGWRIGYQHHPLGNGGPWNFEKLWWPQHDGQPSYIVPPIINIDNGPSGLVYNYGTGLPETLADQFLLCHFKGASANSRITSYKLKPRGAGFEMASMTEFLGDVLPTDVDIGPDGAIYFSDWHQGWPKSSKGRIYKVTHTASRQNPAVLLTQKLLGEGMTQRSDEELGALLGNPDMRVRREAQFELVSRGSSGAVRLLAAATTKGALLPRIHGIWGLSQQGRTNMQAIIPLASLLRDVDPEVRAQTAKAIGEAKASTLAASVRRLLQDPHPRVRAMAAMAASKLGDRNASPLLIKALETNQDADPFLRHSLVLALSRLAEPSALLQASKHPSTAVRRGALLALRKLERPEIQSFLRDRDPQIVAEAARAINDVPIPGAMAALGVMTTEPVDSLSLGYRIVNANFRLGDAAAAVRLAEYSARRDVPAETRVEALRDLAEWAQPGQRDRVVGTYRPLPSRDGKPAADALKARLSRLLRQNNETVLIAAAQACVKLNIAEADALLAEVTRNASLPARARVEALHALAELKGPSFNTALSKAFEDNEELLRREATRLQSRFGSADAFNNLRKALEKGSVGEKQDALLAISELGDAGVDALLLDYLKQLSGDKLAAELRLDVIEAASKRKDPAVQRTLESYRASVPNEAPATTKDLVQGGDKEAGRKIFYERQDVACFRCHQIRGEGGEVGPVLTDVGSKQNREYLLESILLPNKQIAPGFENVMLSLKDGRDYAGLVKSETPEQLVLNSPEDGVLTLKKSEIKNRQRGLSAMPEEMGKILSARDLRNLVEFLASLKP